MLKDSGSEGWFTAKNYITKCFLR